MDLVSARRNMVDSQVRTSDVTNTAIHAAMLAVPREAFCAPDRAFAAYADLPAPITADRELMHAREIAKLLQALEPRTGERALALAAPYAAAVLKHMGLDVTAQEADDAVIARVAPALDAEGVGLAAAPLEGPVGTDWDLIVSEGAVAAIPDAWISALRPGGRMAVVERDGRVGRAVLVVKSASGAVSSRNLFDAAPRVLAGFERAPTFQL